MVYYLAAPYGHLMLQQMEGTQARTTARGNLFSFELPWEDVSARCKEADTAWYAAATAAKRSCALPHDEDVLATLVNVHIVGGSAEAVAELDGATLRTERESVKVNVSKGRCQEKGVKDVKGVKRG